MGAGGRGWEEEEKANTIKVERNSAGTKISLRIIPHVPPPISSEQKMRAFRIQMARNILREI